MKQKLTLYFIILMIAWPVVVNAQQQDKHYMYERLDYIVKKKTEALPDIAKKLQVDPRELSAVNDSMSMDTILVKGQKIKYPLYTEMKIWSEHNPAVTNAQEQSGKSKAGTEAKQSGKKSKKKDGAASQTAGSENKAKETAVTRSTPLPPIDTDFIQNSILLTDATLDLNKALLQGIHASLDSLNVKDKNIIDEKNISLTIHRMQRQRDKAMLTPVLLHMQDSLQTEIKKEENEKATFEKMLGKNEPAQPQPDTLAVTASNITETKEAAAPVENENTTNKQPVTKHVEATAKTGHPEKVHVRPVIEANPATETATGAPPVMHWETAKAIYFNNDTDAEINSSDAVKDTTAYAPAIAIGTELHGGMSDSSRIIKARYFYTRALKVSNEKNYKTAAEYLKKAIDLSPKYYDAWFALGETDAHSGLYTKALNEFMHCKTLDSSNAALYYKMGIAQLRLKQKGEAFNNFNQALKRDSNYVPAIISLAAEYVERNQLKTAIKQYSRVIKIDPSYHTVYKSKAMAEYSLKNYSTAIDDFTKFIIFNETDGSVYYYRALSKLKEGNMSDACTDLSVSARLGYPAALKALQANCK